MSNQVLIMFTFRVLSELASSHLFDLFLDVVLAILLFVDSAGRGLQSWSCRGCEFLTRYVLERLCYRPISAWSNKKHSRLCIANLLQNIGREEPNSDGSPIFVLKLV